MSKHGSRSLCDIWFFVLSNWKNELSFCSTNHSSAIRNMSTYDVDNVTVSLSRLALAKAIKTPDEEDGADAEPWVKSVIFHQSHVSDAMRDSIEHPGRKSRHMMQQQQQRARPRSQVLLQSEQQQRPPMGDQRKRTRSSSQFLDRTPQQFDRAPRNDTEMRIEQYRQSSVMNNSSSTLRTVGSTSTSGTVACDCYIRPTLGKFTNIYSMQITCHLLERANVQSRKFYSNNNLTATTTNQKMIWTMEAKTMMILTLADQHRLCASRLQTWCCPVSV